MIIEKPILKTAGGRACLSARVRSEKNPKLDERLWIEVPLEQADFLTARSEPFLLAALLPAMRLGEDITVEGEVSKQLLDSLSKWQSYFPRWEPKLYKTVSIKAEKTVTEPERKDGLVPGRSCSFSGGIDSFYNVIKTMRGPEAETEPRRAIFIRGFDFHQDSPQMDVAERQYRQTTADLGLELVVIRTNFRWNVFKNLNVWILNCGPVLLGCTLGLQPAVRLYNVAGYADLSEDQMYGTHPLLDHLLSTESTEIVHFEPKTTRIDKTKLVVAEPHSYNHLRVCWEVADGLNNCCRCPKCIRTMVILDLLDSLDKYTTFPKPLPKRMRNWAPRHLSHQKDALGVADWADEIGRHETASEIRIAVRRSRQTYLWTERLVKLLRLKGEPAWHLRNALFRLYRIIFCRP